MTEMHDLAATMKTLKAYVDKHPNTILVATADHSTGGLSIGADGQYRWNVELIKRIRATAKVISERLLNHPHEWQGAWQQLTGFKLSATDIKAMQQLLSQVEVKQQAVADELQAKVLAQTLAIINDRSYTGWTSSGHTGEDVQIFSYGLESNRFAGNLDNTDIARKLFDYLPAPATPETSNQSSAH